MGTPLEHSLYREARQRCGGVVDACSEAQRRVATPSEALGLIVLVPRAKLNGEVAMPSRSTRLDQCEAQRLGCDPSGALGSMLMTTRSTLMKLDDGDAFLVAQSF